MINRREFLNNSKALSLLPFIGLGKNSVDDFKNGSLEEYIEGFFLKSCKTPTTILSPYKIDGLFLDIFLHRQRRVGCYWFWYNKLSGKEWAAAVDFPIKEMRANFRDFTEVKWEQVVNKVHNKYTGDNRKTQLVERKGWFAWEEVVYYG